MFKGLFSILKKLFFLAAINIYYLNNFLKSLPMDNIFIMAKIYC